MFGWLLRIGLLCGVYVSTAKLGLRLGAVAGFATTVWPPTGISLVTLSLFGYSLWPGIAVGAFLVNASAGAAPLAAAGMAAGNTLEAVLGVYLLQRVVGFRSSLERLRDVLGLVILAAGVSTLFSATVGVVSGWLGGAIPAASCSRAWWSWWVGDMMGDLVLAPLLFVWAERPCPSVAPRRAVEAAALLVCSGFVGLLAFDTQHSARTLNLPYLPFPILIWAALRFGPRGAATTLVAISAVAIWGTAHRAGPFAIGTISESLLSLQLFMSVAATTTLVLAADSTQRRRAEEALRKAQVDLEWRVQERSAELSRANAHLLVEVRERQSTEEKLRANEQELRAHLDSLKQAEASLRQSEARLAEAQRLAHLGSWEWDIAGNIIKWSDEMYRIFGVSLEQFDGAYTAYLELLHPDDRELARQTIQRAYQTGEPYEFEHRILRPDGSVRWIHGRGAVIVDPAGQAVRMLGTGQDITATRQAEEELRRAHDELEVRVEERTAELAMANKRKDEFLAMLAHELRNPIGAISNAAQIFKRVPPGSPAFQRAQATLDRQIRHQVRLLEDLLNVSRIAHGKIALQHQRLELARLVREVVEDHRRAIEEAGLTLSLELQQAPIWVNGDPTRLAQVLDNLLQNAAKFTEPGGKVRVECGVSDIQAPDAGDPTPNTALLTVCDTGIGIDPDMLPHVFETFTQADRSLDRSRGGLGLGLALAKGLVELHGGEVWVESPGRGHGSTFSVRLPVAAEPASDVRKEESLSPPANLLLNTPHERT